MSISFQKNKEDFVCEHCGLQIRGNGYTNHCPKCLYSKHVDIFPGDRQEVCGGLMVPVAMEIKNGETSIVHKCERCGTVRKNRKSFDDNINEIIKLSERPLVY